MMLWDHRVLRHSGNNIAEKVLSILCHIIKGEATIREKLDTQGDKKQATEVDSKTPTTSTSVNPVVPTSTPPQRSIAISPAYVQQVGLVMLSAHSLLGHIFVGWSFSLNRSSHYFFIRLLR